ncbi:hypothetical protein OROHE_016803 [Orobanche hederae]
MGLNDAQTNSVAAPAAAMAYGVESVIHPGCGGTRVFMFVDDISISFAGKG